MIEMMKYGVRFEVESVSDEEDEVRSGAHHVFVRRIRTPFVVAGVRGTRQQFAIEDVAFDAYNDAMEAAMVAIIEESGETWRLEALG